MRFALIALSFLFIHGAFCRAEEGRRQEEASTSSTRPAPCVLMVVAHDGFRDEEYEVPRSVLEENGVKVRVASSDTTSARGMMGLQVKPDLLLSEAGIEDFDCLLFVGGAGAKAYWDDEVAHSLARAAVDSGKVVGAICIAPVILARAGLLRGKKATVFKARETVEAFKKGGVVYTGDEVTLSGRIDTGRDPKAANKFAGKILDLLSRRPEVKEGE